MRFDLDEHSARLAELGAGLAAEFAPHAREHDSDRSTATENLAKLRDAGLYGVAIPRDLGGLGARTTQWLATIEALAKGDASTALGFNMHYVATRIITTLDAVPADVKKRVADLVVRDGALICAPLSEPSASSLLPATYMPTLSARRVPGGLEVSGTKMFASLWEASDYAFMFAHPEWADDPTHVVGFLMPTRQDGAITVTDDWDTLGMRSTRSNQVRISGAFVPDDLVLCEFGDFLGNWIVAQAHIAWGGYTGCYLGVAEGMAEWLQGALGTRTAKGHVQPMGYHPTVSTAMGHIAAQVEAARLMMYHAAWEADENSGPSLNTCAAFLRAKLMVGTAIHTISTLGTTAGGLSSLMRSKGYELMLRDAMTGPIMPPNALACAEMAGLISMGLDPGQAPALRTAS
ncbi:acyl-CoA dehydrogenase family protein [Streptosporangium saharense]|uniref:Alkylation response protein AidB-like acyl-CoA dehydrogenase n=1 Tax=Streptosporangium saharense TaxID=1706840 RepID=A0A7W7QT38_9ACTN|nr:acyl-CoA dehydrogenase family protein [Streptosporangium saharense]MBB4919218.1 alkylation response protein AidB-like acyl-CoA dehydrogenase [Streptosporangium saharense]